MKKFANFLIHRRYVMLIIMIVLAIVCGVLAMMVPINKVRTQYLADHSNMKQGLSLMESAFPEAKEKSSIRVMFDDLTAE
jgi:predicted RND superfamily exporter protein